MSSIYLIFFNYATTIASNSPPIQTDLNNFLDHDFLNLNNLSLWPNENGFTQSKNIISKKPKRKRKASVKKPQKTTQIPPTVNDIKNFRSNIGKQTQPKSGTNSGTSKSRFLTTVPNFHEKLHQKILEQPKSFKRPKKPPIKSSSKKPSGFHQQLQEQILAEFQSTNFSDYEDEEHSAHAISGYRTGGMHIRGPDFEGSISRDYRESDRHSKVDCIHSKFEEEIMNEIQTASGNSTNDSQISTPKPTVFTRYLANPNLDPVKQESRLGYEVDAKSGPTVFRSSFINIKDLRTAQLRLASFLNNKKERLSSKAGPGRNWQLIGLCGTPFYEANEDIFDRAGSGLRSLFFQFGEWDQVDNADELRQMVTGISKDEVKNQDETETGHINDSETLSELLKDIFIGVRVAKR